MQCRTDRRKAGRNRLAAGQEQAQTGGISMALENAKQFLAAVFEDEAF